MNSNADSTFNYTIKPRTECIVNCCTDLQQVQSMRFNCEEKWGKRWKEPVNTVKGREKNETISQLSFVFVFIKTLLHEYVDGVQVCMIESEGEKHQLQKFTQRTITFWLEYLLFGFFTFFLFFCQQLNHFLNKRI